MIHTQKLRILLLGHGYLNTIIIISKINFNLGLRFEGLDPVITVKEDAGSAHVCAIFYGGENVPPTIDASFQPDSGNNDLLHNLNRCSVYLKHITWLTLMVVTENLH